MINSRKLYYFHIQHDRSELGGNCPVSYQNADDEWQAIEQSLKSLPTPNKMYSDSFLPKDENQQHEEVVASPIQLIFGVILQPYLTDDERALLLAVVQKDTSVRTDEQAAFRLMSDFAILPCFSNNDRLLLKLASKGTKLVACENEVLCRDSEMRRADLEVSWGSPRGILDAQRLLQVMFWRNEFIARQIDLSLKSGEIGVLFLGHLHNVDNDMVKRLSSYRITVEEKNECRGHEGLKNLFGAT
jgi:hypothetical protein